jgi:hypothetical protein
MTRLVSPLLLLLLLLSTPSTFAQAAGGPSGSTEGIAFSDHPPTRARVREMRVWSGGVIESVQAVWQSEAGFTEGRRHGGEDGVLNTFQLDEGEHITAISGQYTRDGVSQLLFETSRGRSSAPFGLGGGRRGRFAEFRYEAPEGHHIVGFVGRSGDSLYAIGALLEKL